MKRFISILACGVIALAGLAGCKEQQSAKIVVTYAVLKVIEKGDTPQDQLARAAKIRDIAEKAKAATADESVVIPVLEEIVRAEVGKLSLSPADRTLANLLVQTVIAELSERVGSGVIPPDKQVLVRDVLTWVIDATAYVGT